MTFNPNYTGELISELTNLELSMVAIQAKRDYILKLVGIHAGVLAVDPTLALSDKDREVVYKFIKDQRESQPHLSRMHRLTANSDSGNGDRKDAITLFGGREDRH